MFAAAPPTDQHHQRAPAPGREGIPGSGVSVISRKPTRPPLLAAPAEKTVGAPRPCGRCLGLGCASGKKERSCDVEHSSGSLEHSAGSAGHLLGFGRPLWGVISWRPSSVALATSSIAGTWPVRDTRRFTKALASQRTVRSMVARFVCVCRGVGKVALLVRNVMGTRCRVMIWRHCRWSWRGAVEEVVGRPGRRRPLNGGSTRLGRRHPWVTSISAKRPLVAIGDR